MGKWDQVSKTLTKLPATHREGGDEYQRKVDLKKLEIGTREPIELAQVYREVRRGKDRTAEELYEDVPELLNVSKEELEALTKANNLKMTAIEQLLSDVYEAKKLSSMKLADGASVSTQSEPYVVVKDRAALRTWLATNGHLELLDTLVPPWQTLNSMLKDQLEAGLDCPDGTEAFIKTKIVLRKG